MELQEKSGVKWSAIALPFIFVLFALMDEAHIASPAASQAVETVMFLVVCVIWCVEDARRRGIRASAGKLALVAAFPPVGILVYLVGTRGWRQGLIAYLKAALILLAAVAINVAVRLLIRTLEH